MAVPVSNNPVVLGNIARESPGCSHHRHHHTVQFTKYAAMQYNIMRQCCKQQTANAITTICICTSLHTHTQSKDCVLVAIYAILHSFILHLFLFGLQIHRKMSYITVFIASILMTLALSDPQSSWPLANCKSPTQTIFDTRSHSPKQFHPSCYSANRCTCRCCQLSSSHMHLPQKLYKGFIPAYPARIL